MPAEYDLLLAFEPIGGVVQSELDMIRITAWHQSGGVPEEMWTDNNFRFGLRPNESVDKYPFLDENFGKEIQVEISHHQTEKPAENIDGFIVPDKEYPEIEELSEVQPVNITIEPEKNTVVVTASIPVEMQFNQETVFAARECETFLCIHKNILIGVVIGSVLLTIIVLCCLNLRFKCTDSKQHAKIGIQMNEQDFKNDGPLEAPKDLFEKDLT